MKSAFSIWSGYLLYGSLGYPVLCLKVIEIKKTKKTAFFKILLKYLKLLHC